MRRRDPKADQASAEAALHAAMRTLENCDLAAMEAAFAPDAVTFDRVLATAEGSGPLDLAAYRRQPGLPNGLRQLAEVLPRLRPGGPPYQKLEPLDLMVQVSGDMALCTFHLESRRDGLGRRTIVLIRRDGDWRILHLHASNVRA